MLTKNCKQCGREITVRGYDKDRLYCSKECIKIARHNKKVNPELHTKYFKEYSLAVKKAKLLALQRQNYIDELLLEQLSTTPDLKTRIQIVDTNGMILNERTEKRR